MGRTFQFPVGWTFQSVMPAILRCDDRLESRSHSQAGLFNSLIGVSIHQEPPDTLAKRARRLTKSSITARFPPKNCGIDA